jgi:hypothetical protein
MITAARIALITGLGIAAAPIICCVAGLNCQNNCDDYQDDIRESIEDEIFVEPLFRFDGGFTLFGGNGHNHHSSTVGILFL